MKTYTPLRYPGGKTKIYNMVKTIIESNFETKPIYVEGFAGGSGLALKLLFSNVVTEIHINDYDYAIYSIWYSILNNKNELIHMIEKTDINIEAWKKQKEIYLNQLKYNILEIGFATLFLNRVNRSGIINAGPIGGINQTGNYKIDCRFNKEAIIKLINMIYEKRDKIFIYQKDAKEFITDIDKKYKNLFIYLDPPYVEKGPELYKNSFTRDDHINLFNSTSMLQNNWFTTYDNTTFISTLYKNLKQHNFNINYSLATRQKGIEIAIYSNNLKIPE